MAQTPIKADDLWGQWSRRTWKLHYLFTGQEDFLIDEAIQKATRHWLGENPDPLSIERLDAEVQSVEEIAQALQTAAFFGSTRVIRIENTGCLTAKVQERLAPVLATVAPETHCLFIWGKDWRRDDVQKALPQAITAKGDVVIFWPLFSSQAERWVTERAKSYHKTLASQAAHWLIQQSGEGLRTLDHELAKCASFVGARPVIELEDVQTSFGYAKASSPFDWVSMIRRQDSGGALSILDHLLEEGEEPVRLLALLSRSVRDWLSAKGSGENAAMLAMRFHVKRGDENRFAQELGRWSAEKLSHALQECVEAEESIKSGKETPEMALTLLTLGLSRGQAAYAGSQT